MQCAGLAREIQLIGKAIDLDDVNFALNLNAIVGAPAGWPPGPPAETKPFDPENALSGPPPTDGKPGLNKFHNYLK